MRLTLRTLLAYLDGVLGTDDARDLQNKIEHSPLAQDLVRRIEDSRQSGSQLSRTSAAPSPYASGEHDANRVAEYLDSTLRPELEPEFERHCLEADMHLGEVAACHQILSMVVRERTAVPQSTRERIHALRERLGFGSADPGGPPESLESRPGAWLNPPGAIPSESASGGRAPATGASDSAVYGVAAPSGGDARWRHDDAGGDDDALAAVANELESPPSHSPTPLPTVPLLPDAESGRSSWLGMTTLLVGLLAIALGVLAVRPEWLSYVGVGQSPSTAQVRDSGGASAPEDRDAAGESIDRTAVGSAATTTPGAAAPDRIAPPTPDMVATGVDPIGPDVEDGTMRQPARLRPAAPLEREASVPASPPIEVAADTPDLTDRLPRADRGLPDSAALLADEHGLSADFPTGVAEEDSSVAIDPGLPPQSLEGAERRLDPALAAPRPDLDQIAGNLPQDPNGLIENADIDVADIGAANVDRVLPSGAGDVPSVDVPAVTDAATVAALEPTAIPERPRPEVRLEQERDVVLHASEEGPAWRRAGVGVVPLGERLVVLPTYRAELETNQGLRLTMVGPCEWRMEVRADRTLVLDLAHGSFLVTSLTDDTRLAWRGNGRQMELQLQPAGTQVAVAVARVLPAGGDPMADAAIDLPATRSVTRIVTLDGAVVLSDGQQENVLRPDQHWNLVDQMSGFPTAATDVPDWVDGTHVAAIDQRASRELEPFLPAEGAVLPILIERADDRRVEQQALAARCLITIGEYEEPLASLNHAAQHAYWPRTVQALRECLTYGTPQANALRQMFETKRGSDGLFLFQLLCGYSQEELDRGAAAELVAALAHASLDIRVLAAENLYWITGMRNYRPEESIKRRMTYLSRWQRALANGEIRYASDPFAVPDLPADAVPATLEPPRK